MAILSREVAIAVNNAAPEVLSSRMNRRAVWIFPSGGSVTQWSFGKTPVLGVVGFIVQSGVTPFCITREQIGPQIDQALSVVAVTNGTSCAVIESFDA